MPPKQGNWELFIKERSIARAGSTEKRQQNTHERNLMVCQHQQVGSCWTGDSIGKEAFSIITMFWIFIEYLPKFLV
jgi:hypothetical protein